MMDSLQVTEKLNELIKLVTETGEWVLEADNLKLIKSICKRSDYNVNIAFELVMTQLNKKHAQIRYSSLQLIEQLFDRSKHFRDLLTEDFPILIQLVVGVQDKKLPPPLKVAKKLKEYSLALIKAWFIKYGQRYHQLGIAFEFLTDNGCYNNSGSLLANIHASDRNKSNIDARKHIIHLDRYELLNTDIQDHIDIIQDNLNTMESCFEILIPKNDILDNDIDFNALMRGEATYSQKQDDSYKDTMLSHGLGSNRYKITVNLSEESIMEDIKESNDNSIVFDQLREAYTVLETKHTQQLNVWINALIKIDIADKSKKEKLVSKLINLKGKAAEESRKAKLLGIQVSHRKVKKVILKDGNDDDDEYQDELFEEVDIPVTTTMANKNIQTSSKLPPLQRIFPLSFEPNMIEDATYNGPTIESSKRRLSIEKGKQKADPKKEDLLQRAPVVEWGDDLYYWDKTDVQFNTSGIEKSHRFLGVGEGDNEIPKHVLQELRKRTVYYKSEAPKDLQSCKHPLNNGGLCPRKDLVTCPFHGRIIPRDELGIPLNKADIPESSTTLSLPQKSKPPSVMDNLWELIEGDVMDQSGHQKVTAKGRKVKEKSSLINLRKKVNTSTTRLKRQIESPKTKKMVQEAVEYERHMKLRNKEKL